MALSNLTSKLTGVFAKFRGKGKISEKDLKEGMREVRLALLEADVNLGVVKDFVREVSETALGENVLESLQPDQQIIKIVRDKLTELMGAQNTKLNIASKPPTCIMMCGLQGAGKTTTSAKLAAMLKKQGKRPLLIACDIYRPAAIKQLCIVGNNAGVPVYSEEDNKDVVQIATNGLAHANTHGNDVIIIDTAGRLHIDEALMDELQRITQAIEITELLLTVDAMTGQDAANVSKAFNEQLEITGVILTKFDSDTRGGAALSVRSITGKPIKFITTGEKLDGIEPFYPDRIAQRILGMGDILTIIDKAEAAIDEKKAKELEEKLRKSRFTLSDYLDQLDQIKGMGMQDIMDLMPGMSKLTKGQDLEINEKAMDHTKAIILSMTHAERENPSILNGGRKRRIAAGSGTTVQDINALLKQFDQMQSLIKQMSGMSGKMKGKKKMKLPFM